VFIWVIWIQINAKKTVLSNVAHYTTSYSGTTQWHCVIHNVAVEKIQKIKVLVFFYRQIKTEVVTAFTHTPLIWYMDADTKILRFKVFLKFAKIEPLKTQILNTDIRRLTTGIRSEKRVVRWFRRCANVYLQKPREYSLLLLGYKPVQHVTVLNTVGKCNTIVI
jgi:hypothetical protein